MAKKVIRLNESDLHSMIKEAVNQILIKENSEVDSSFCTSENCDTQHIAKTLNWLKTFSEGWYNDPRADEKITRIKQYVAYNMEGNIAKIVLRTLNKIIYGIQNEDVEGVDMMLEDIITQLQNN
jgi:uncharacterized membrane-anchored protein YjiN (DUF445 family)